MKLLPFYVSILHTIGQSTFWLYPPQATNTKVASIKKGRTPRKTIDPTVRPVCIPQATALSRPVACEQHGYIFAQSTRLRGHCSPIIHRIVPVVVAIAGYASTTRMHQIRPRVAITCNGASGIVRSAISSIGSRTLFVHGILIAATRHTDVTPTAAPPRRAHKEKTRQIYETPCE